jgi:hypothetical protein
MDVPAEVEVNNPCDEAKAVLKNGHGIQDLFFR